MGETRFCTRFPVPHATVTAFRPPKYTNTDRADGRAASVADYASRTLFTSRMYGESGLDHSRHRTLISVQSKFRRSVFVILLAYFFHKLYLLIRHTLRSD